MTGPSAEANAALSPRKHTSHSAMPPCWCATPEPSACVHCGWPKGDPNGCSTFCTVEHDVEEHNRGTSAEADAALTGTLATELLDAVAADLEHRDGFHPGDPCAWYDHRDAVRAAYNAVVEEANR